MYRQLKFLSKDNIVRLLLVAAVLYIPVHAIVGAWTCYTEFCPGDNEDDYVYSYIDEDTHREMIIVDGKAIPLEAYIAIHKAQQQEKQ
jgi:hypothetical protein